MKKRRGRYLFALVLLITLIGSMTGCGMIEAGKSWKDSILDGYNNWMQSFSKYALTKETDLQGEKTEGSDHYTGEYEATYENFNGKEILFGGTALEREAGNQLSAEYTLKITSGNGVLYWQDRTEKREMIKKSGKGNYEFTIHSGDNYLVFEGERFTGTLSLKVS